jgi:hypothetical protein
MEDDLAGQNRAERCTRSEDVAFLKLHSQHNVLVSNYVALTRLFFDILRAAAAGTSTAGIGRERTVSRRGAARKAATQIHHEGAKDTKY